MNDRNVPENAATGGKKKRSILMPVLICAVALAVLAAAILILKRPAGSRELTVGTDVSIDDVTDFYYTVASSAYPPEYLRYRFYTADGAYFFFREKREGDHFPLTEADATVSETSELTPAEWNAFFDCVSGGMVTDRTEDTSTGYKGPFLYIYWKGDRSVCQQFTFASPEKQDAFVALCTDLASRTPAETTASDTETDPAAPVTDISYEQIPQDEAKRLMDSGADLVILDVREQDEFDASHIPGAILLPYTETGELAPELLPDKTKLILVYCRSGRRSKIAAASLAAMGYTNVKEFGGIIDWPYETES